MVYARNGDSTGNVLYWHQMGQSVLRFRRQRLESFLAAVGVLAKRDTRIGGGLAIGDVPLDPLDRRPVMKERTADTGATPADTAQIWVQDAAGVQKLYIKFANGVQREIATA
jgi:hypothetical protein